VGKIFSRTPVKGRVNPSTLRCRKNALRIGVGTASHQANGLTMQHYFGLLSYGDGHNSLNRQERGQDAAPAPIEPKLESTAVAVSA